MLTTKEIRRVNRMCPVGSLLKMGDRIKFLDKSGGLLGAGGGNGKAYFVDNVSGSDINDGLSWGKALKTIARAITLSNATVNWSYTPKHYNYIYIKPGVYAENLAVPFYCHMVGLGVPGTDTQAEIHPATGSCMTGTFLGTVLENLWFEVHTAIPCLNIGICNNSMILDCVFTNDAAVAATAVDTDNCTHLTMMGCSVESGQTTGMGYGIYARGGADKYFHNCRIIGNIFNCGTAGIFIQDTCTASETVIADNIIARPTKGIDDNNGTTRCVNNWITATSDAIEHANSATLCIANHVINNATGAVEATGTD